MSIATRSLLLIFIIFLNGFVLLSSAVAQTPIGKIISVTGNVRAINQANQTRILQRRSEIYLRDRIVTDLESKAQLILQDDSVIVVQASSEYYISEFVFNKAAPRNNKYVGNIVTGALINISGKGDSKNYQLNSALVTIAFRGTGVATNLSTRNGVPFNQEVNVFQGYVNVSNRCENVIGVCNPASVEIGIGRKANSVVVDAQGKMIAMTSAALGGYFGKGVSDKTLVGQGESGKAVSIKCKARKR